MRSWAQSIGVLGIVVLNLIFVSIRLFARSQGVKVRWWSRSYASERAHLRMLARGGDVALASRARMYLRLEILAWILFLPFAGVFFWGVVTQDSRSVRLVEAGQETWRVGPREYHLSSTHYERGPGTEVRYVMTYPVSVPTGSTSIAADAAAEQALPLIRYAYEHRTYERTRVPPARGTEHSQPNLVVELTSISDGRSLFRYEVPAGEISWRLAHPTEP